MSNLNRAQFKPGVYKVMWEAPSDDDDPDAFGELGSGNYCMDCGPSEVARKKAAGFDVNFKLHDTDWGQGCEGKDCR